jgi:1-aminocyclopropane-1-carboxylate deaminase/D-cysteine desulfhydrase-like pyridoxal-dependent ACC family enzyme
MIDINILNSPVEQVNFKDHTFLLKRDDLLHSDFTGNKARKFHYFLQNDFPQISTLISHGSNQSNAMYSLSVLCKLKNWKFIYYTHHIPSFLEQNPNGNYKYSLANGMDIRSFKENQTIEDITYNSKNTILIKEGGAIQEASYGIKQLANEIDEYRVKNNIKNLKVFLPSGTGTTAHFLQKYLDIEVLTTPCVGNSDYLQKQFQELSSNTKDYPTIIESKKKYHFGKLYRSNYLLYKELLEETNIEFDLLYDPIGMETFLNYIKNKNNIFLYIHQGGIKGNITMIQRYKHKYNDLDS